MVWVWPGSSGVTAEGAPRRADRAPGGPRGRDGCRSPFRGPPVGKADTLPRPVCAGGRDWQCPPVQGHAVCLFVRVTAIHCIRSAPRVKEECHQFLTF